MKKYKFCKEKIKTLGVGLFVSSIIFSRAVFASDTEFKANFSEEYKKWLNSEKTQTEEIMPRTYYSEIPESILKEYEYKKKEKPSLKNEFLVKAFNLDNVSAIADSPRYNLAEEIPIRIKHQGSTTECWAFGLISCMESNIALRNNLNDLQDVPDFSERHMDYSTASNFKDGTNEKGYDRVLGKGGIPIMGLSYLTNGTGAVLEEEMPFEDNEDEISLSELDKPVDTTVTGYKMLNGILKKFDENGNIHYTDELGKEYTDDEVKAVRKIIKENIVANGAIESMTAGNKLEYYNNQENPAASTAYFCNDSNVTRDHAITIVGWDDNYSKDNFNEKHRPSTDGAYIVLNSYGNNMFDKGYIYISYEDVLIESDLYVVENTEKINYDNLYQNDFFGGLFSVGTTTSDTGYYGNVYSRDYSKNNEYLTDVGITVSDYVNVEIYLNPKGNSTVLSSLTKVGESSNVLEPGYHKIKVTPTKLTGNDFAIVVKQKSENGIFYFTIETAIEDTVYSNVKSSGNSYYSMDGYSWNNINDLSVSGIDMKSSDVCVKAFTKYEEEEEKEEFYSNEYKITEDAILKVKHQTTKEEFLKNIVTNLEVKIYTQDDKEVIDDSEIIKTGMKLKLSNGKEYMIAVRGDINGDGKITLVDLSRLILHYSEAKDYILTGAALKGADLSCDDKVSLMDISQMIVLYTHL